MAVVFASGIVAPGTQALAQERPLKVGVGGTEPFVFYRDGQFSGMAVDVLQAVAGRLNRKLEFVRLESVMEALQKVANNEVDLAAGPYSITAQRAQRVDFTQPYFESSLGILSPRIGVSDAQRAQRRYFQLFWQSVLVLLIATAFMALLVWLLERRSNRHYAKGFLVGWARSLWRGMYLLVGVSDEYPPKSPVAKVISWLWLAVGRIFWTGLTAVAVVVLLLPWLQSTNLDTADKLEQQRVAVVEGTTGEDFARRFDALIVQASDLPSAVQRMKQGMVDAVVFDRPMLRYFLQQHPNLDFQISANAYDSTGYGFMLPKGSEDLRRQLNVAILELTERQELEAIEKKWLGYSY